MPADDPEARAFIADCNLRRHGWDAFQRGARRSALRTLRHLDREAVVPRYKVRTVEADPTGRPLDFWKAPPEPIHYVHDTLRDRPVFGSYHDRAEADQRCASLNETA